MSGYPGTPTERFERLYIPEPNTGCWLWIGSLSAQGYGHFYFPPRNMVRAHVAAWEIFRGDRHGLHVCHSCDIRCCVNPEHLWLGTHQENIADRDQKGRGYDRSGVANGRARLTETIVRAIRADGRPPRFIARDYPKIPFSTIQKIRNRQTWKHI